MKISLKSRFIFAITTIAGIFVADLTITILNKYIMTLSSRFDAHIVTAVGMCVVLALFYVLVSNIQKFSDWMVRTFVKIGRRYVGRSIGLYSLLLVLVLLLFSGYYWAWFDKSFPKECAQAFLAQIDQIRTIL